MVTETRLLSDLPASEDAFGSHSRVADAIREMILCEEGGHAIALQGSWGSGKSTIVKLLEGALKEQVFVFDAWAHEGDPLRRVFLEKLYGHCESKLSKKKRAAWKKRCANLRARERTDEKREIPQLSWGALLIATLLLLSPLALLVLNSWLRAATTEWWHYLGLVYLPIALIPVGAAILRCFRRDAGEAVALVITRKIGRTTTTTKETPEPTSIEFESFFGDLLADTIGDKDERLLIVVDNLDRVLAQHALETWSTLRVFVERMSAGRDAWCKRVWLLVPYDKPSMDRLWAVNGSAADGAQKDERSARSPRKPAAFLDKTFQVRFEVPPLVLADWKEYLESLLESAFPDHGDADQRQRVYRLSALLAEKNNRPPTPRHLKLYVNDIGALRRQHGDTFPLHHMAYLAILRRQEVDVRYELVTGSIPDSTFAEVLSDGIEDHLAALLFNTDDIEKARDLLLRQPILDALAAGDADKLRELSSRRGFWPLAETVLPEAPLGWGERPEAAANAAKAVSACDLANSDGHPEARRAVRAFARAISQAVVWKRFDAGMGEGIAAALDLGRSEEVSRELFERVLSGGVFAEGDDVEAHAGEWVGGLVKMLRAAAALKHSSCYSIVRIDCEPAALVSVLAAFRAEDPDGHFWAFLASTADGAKILPAVVPLGTDKPWEPHKRAAVDVLLRSRIDMPWAEFAKKCHELLQVDAASSPKIVAQLIQALRDVAPQAKNAASLWQTLAAGGHLLHHFNACNGAQHADSGALLVVEIIRHVQLAKAAPAFGNAPAGLELLKGFMLEPGEHPELLDSVYKQFVSGSGETLLLKLIEQKGVATPLVTALVNLLLERSQVAAVLAPPFFVQRWQHLHSMLGDSVFDRLLAALVEAGGLLAHLVGTPFKLANSALLRRVLSIGGFEDSSFCSWVSEGLSAVSSDDWLPELRSESDGLRLLLEYRKQRGGLHLGHALSDALEALGKEVMRDDDLTESVPVQDVRESIEALTAEGRVVLGKELVDAATSIEDPVSEFTFALFGDVLAVAISTGEHRNALRRVLTPIVQEQQPAAGAWMADLLESNAGLLERFPPEDVKDLMDRVVGTLDAGAEAFAPVAERLRVALGIPKPEAPSEPVGDSD